MNYIIYKITKYFYSLLATKDTTRDVPTETEIEKKTKNSEYVCSISYFLTTDNDIDMSFSVAGFEDMPLEGIAPLGERCAELLLSINHGFFQDRLLKTIKSNSRKLEDYREKLLLDNVIIFYKFLEKDIMDMKNGKEPLIRPNSVFRGK